MANDIRYKVQSLKEINKKVPLVSLRISDSNQMYIVHKALTKQLTERRQGSANCKTRSEVRGGGKKPWRQKGTGRARAGSSRSPLWRGGGVIFGPKTKNYHQKVNKKEKRLAISNLLFNKANFTFATENISFDDNKPKTRLLIAKIKELGIDTKEKILVITSDKNRGIYLAARNISNIEIIKADQLNALAIIKAKYVLIEIDAIDIITRIYNG